MICQQTKKDGIACTKPAKFRNGDIYYCGVHARYLSYRVPLSSKASTTAKGELPQYYASSAQWKNYRAEKKGSIAMSPTPMQDYESLILFESYDIHLGLYMPELGEILSSVEIPNFNWETRRDACMQLSNIVLESMEYISLIQHLELGLNINVIDPNCISETRLLRTIQCMFKNLEMEISVCFFLYTMLLYHLVDVELPWTA